MEKSKRAISARTLILLFAAVVLCALGLAGGGELTPAHPTPHSEKDPGGNEQKPLGGAAPR